VGFPWETERGCVYWRVVPVLTAREAARRLGCSVQYVRRLLRSGRLRGSKVGRDWVVEEDEVARWSALHAVAPLFGQGMRRRQRRGGLPFRN
jgi:excisionase family DNA binding protein